MATIDLSTGKISGCEEGSRVWWHEKGHEAFNNTDWGARIDYWQYHFMMMGVFFCALSVIIDNLYLHVFTFLNTLGMICSYLYQEVWAWAYSFRNYKKN